MFTITQVLATLSRKISTSCLQVILSLQPNQVAIKLKHVWITMRGFFYFCDSSLNESYVPFMSGNKLLSVNLENFLLIPIWLVCHILFVYTVVLFMFSDPVLYNTITCLYLYINVLHNEWILLFSFKLGVLLDTSNPLFIRSTDPVVSTNSILGGFHYVFQFWLINLYLVILSI